ncbi:alpha/beta hydrolase [Streptomyces gamaensis]|uniref:Alpha/beta hydrolase n=1 Tax=Streptomyces gamaensis TaxID=1763542 RepID=A0ABW0YXG0_9ACTN
MTHTPAGAGTYGPEDSRPTARARHWLVAVASVTVLALIAWPVMSHFEIPPFTDKGDPVSFGQPQPPPAPEGQAGGNNGAQPADSKVLMPTGPQAEFTNTDTLGDGTHIAETTLEGRKSGFTGKVWVWAPKEYADPKYANAGFPVLIALPGGPGYPKNYWIGRNLKLQQSIAKWYSEGRSKPFLLAMPVLNPDAKRYYDGSDIPGQPKMGTWLTEDVPDLMKANFRTVKSRDGWAFMGSSSGGFAGLKAVLKHPDRFKAVIASGPDIVPDSPMWKGHDKEKAENNPEVLAKQLIDRKGPDVYLAFQVGTKEEFPTMRNVKRFIDSYGHGPVHTTLREIPGGKHDAATYVPSMGEGPIEWISRQLEGPTPAS